MSNIQTHLDKIKSARYGRDVRQSIHDAIKEIDAVADTAQNSAAKSAASALASETSAKASMESALVSEANAKQYMEQAFAGTPDGYSALVEQVGLLDIQESTDYVCPGSKPGGYRLEYMKGNTVQGADPSPDNKQSLNHTFDVVEMIQGNYNNTTGVYSNSTYYVCNKYPIPCKGGDKIKISCDSSITALVIIYFNENGHLSYEVNSSNEREFSAPSGATKFCFNVQNSNGHTPDTVGKITLTINDKYVGCVKTLKELFDGESESATYNVSTGVKNGNSGWCCGKNPISCKSGERITIKHSFDVNLFRFLFYKTDGTFVNCKQSSENTTEFECVADNDGYFIWCILDDIVILSSTLGELSISSGMQGTVAYFLTDEPLRLGDILYKDSDVLFKVEHGTNEVVLNGGSNETWSISAYQRVEGSTGFDVATNYPRSSSAISCLCTHFLNKGNEITDNFFDGGCWNGGSDYTYLNFRICTSLFSTVDELTTWLASNPITVQYRLYTPTIEVLDTESQIALNSIETFDTVTYIEVDSRVPASGIKGQYGTSDVGALALENANLHDTVNLTTVKGSIANNLTTTEEGFVLDARQGTALQRQITLQNTSFAGSLATKAIKVLTYNLTEVEILPYEEGWAGVGAVFGYTNYSIIGVLKIEVNDGLSIVRYNDAGVTLYNHTGTSITVTGTITLLYANNGLIN